MWIIEKDHYAEGEPGRLANAVGLTSRNFVEGTALPHRFRMLTDDKELVYEGRASEETHAPLDDFGMPNFGCTEIHYFAPGKGGGWKPL